MKYKIVATYRQLQRYQHKNIGIVRRVGHMQWLFWNLTKLQIYEWSEVAAFLKTQFTKVSSFYGLTSPLKCKIQTDKNYNFQIIIIDPDLKLLNINNDFWRTLEYLLIKITFNHYGRNLKITISIAGPSHDKQPLKHPKSKQNNNQQALSDNLKQPPQHQVNSALKKQVKINYQQRNWIDRIHAVAQEVRKKNLPIVISPASNQNRKIIHQVVAQYKVLTSKTIRTGEKNQAIIIQKK